MYLNNYYNNLYSIQLLLKNINVGTEINIRFDCKHSNIYNDLFLQTTYINVLKYCIIIIMFDV